jgi:hypothetical protein
MTLLENRIPECDESVEERQRKKSSGILDDLELVQSQSDSYQSILAKDPYSELRFFRK